MAPAKHFGLRGRALGYSILCTAVLPAYLLYGYNQAVAGNLTSGLTSWDTLFPQIDIDAKVAPSVLANRINIEGITVSLYTAAGIFGSLFCAWSSEKLGRRKSVFIGAGTALVGALIQCTAFSLGQLIAGRIVAGLGNGCYLATVPNLQAETTRPEKRGGVIQYLSVFALAGLALASWVDLGLYFTNPSSVAWRFPLALPMLLALFVIAGAMICPESPRWLVSTGKVQEAREIMSSLYDEDPDSDLINTEIAEIQAAMQAEKGSLADCFRMGEKRVLHRTIICCGIQMFQQITGVNCLAYFSATIFTSLGLSAVTSRILAGALFTFSSLVSMVGVWTVDRFGRRPLLLISAFGNGISMLVITITSAYITSSKAAGDVGTLFVFFFFFFFPVGFLGVTFAYAAEIAPNHVRSQITAMSTATVWAFNFMTVEVTPTGTSTLGYRFFIIWTIMNLCFILPSVYFFFPETKGLSLEGIDSIFIKSKGWFQPVWVAKKIHKGEVEVEVEGKEEDVSEKEIEVKKVEDENIQI